jgi:hypothetical protein
VSPVAGTDSHSNSFPAGLALINGKQVLQIHNNSAFIAPAIEMITGIGTERGHGSLYTYSPNPGTAGEYEELVVQGPASTVDGNAAEIILTGSSKDGTTLAASGLLYFNGTRKLQWNQDGVYVATGSGLLGRPAPTNCNYPNITAGSATGFTPLSSTWTIPANDAGQFTRYRVTGFGIGTVNGVSRMDFAASAYGVTTGRGSIASGVFNSPSNLSFDFDVEVQVLNPGTNATIFFKVKATATTSGADATASTSITTTHTQFINGVNTTGATNIQFLYQCAAGANVLTMTTYMDTFERLGS